MIQFILVLAMNKSFGRGLIPRSSQAIRAANTAAVLACGFTHPTSSGVNARYSYAPSDGYVPRSVGFLAASWVCWLLIGFLIAHSPLRLTPTTYARSATTSRSEYCTAICNRYFDMDTHPPALVLDETASAQPSRR